MSRSKKKPYHTDQQNSRGSKSAASRSVLAKRDANRAVRRAMKQAIEDPTKHLANGKSYRKASNSWDIRDWSFYSPKDKKAYRK